MIVWYLFEMRTSQEVGNDAENDPGEEAPLPDFPRLIGLVPGEKTASSLEEPIVIECDSDDDSDDDDEDDGDDGDGDDDGSDEYCWTLFTVTKLSLIHISEPTRPY